MLIIMIYAERKNLWAAEEEKYVEFFLLLRKSYIFLKLYSLCDYGQRQSDMKIV